MVQNKSTLELPSRASLEHLRNQAKALLKAHRAGDVAAAARVGAWLVESTAIELHDAQFVLAREYGFPSWPKLVAQLEPPHSADRVRRKDGRVWLEGVPRLRWGSSVEPTYLGALEAAFRASDRPLELVNLMGDSGLCFRLRWGITSDRDAWCGSGPCGEWPAEVAALNRATGYVFEWDDPRPMPASQIEKIVACIDRGEPVLGYPLQMDMGIVFGYEEGGQKLVVSDYWAREEAQVIAATEAKMLGLFLIRREPPAARAVAARAGLELALQRWKEGVVERDRGTGSTYFYGPAGYARWIADLERADALSEEQRRNLWHISSWTYSSLHANRSGHAAEYLRKHVQYFPVGARAKLELARAEYQKAAARLGKWDSTSATFGMVKQQKFETWTGAVRSDEIALLRDLWQIDAAAMAAIERALAEPAPAH